MPRATTKSTHIGLAFIHTLSYYRQALHGIWRYAEARPHWELTPVIPGDRALNVKSKHCPDGLIVTANTRAFEESLKNWRRPAVNVSAVIEGLRFPRVGVDNAKVGQMAAAHFLERGLEHTGFVGPPNQLFSNHRQIAFCEAVENAGATVDCFISRVKQEFDPLGLHWDLEASVDGWLKKLPKPVGIFAPNDLWGIQVIRACRRAELRVPEDVAVLGVDNDGLYCEMTRPQLSSVIIPAEQIGYEAVAMLERLLGGELPPTEPLLLPPVGIKSRRSTEVLAIEDEQVVAAVRFIREWGHLPLHVEDILRQLPVGRRTLERRFRQFLGWGIAEEIQRTHLSLAQRLLAATDLSMQAVAIQSGFLDYRHMARVFRRYLDITPTAYRERMNWRRFAKTAAKGTAKGLS